MRFFRPLALCLALSGAASAQGNILLIIADDLGVDRVGAYGEHPDPGRTPVIDGLAQRGVLFRNAWSYPLCSPTRATILTGRHGFRTGIGKPIKNGFGLSDDEVTLPELLAPRYASVALGKWHLATYAQEGLHPLVIGFDSHAGSMRNLGVDDLLGGGGYSRWDKTTNGVVEEVTTYATTDTVNDALRAVESLPEPWFLWLAFNAPHRPFHAPPDHLHTYTLGGVPFEQPVLHMKAMTEAMDTEIGRLLDALDLETTTVIFVGDNGTAEDAISAPFPTTHGKGTAFEGGLNVPLIIAGPQVSTPGAECDALVMTTDLFATIGELAGERPRAEDSISLLPYLREPLRPSMREYAYAENFAPNGPGPYQNYRQAIRDQRWKLIRRRTNKTELFYDLQQDPFELDDLLRHRLSAEQIEAYQRLSAELDSYPVD